MVLRREEIHIACAVTDKVTYKLNIFTNFSVADKLFTFEQLKK